MTSITQERLRAFRETNARKRIEKGPSKKDVYKDEITLKNTVQQKERNQKGGEIILPPNNLKNINERKGNGMEQIENNNGKQLEPGASNEIQVMDSPSRLVNMNEAIYQANNLTDSSINELKSCMKRIIRPMDLEKHDEKIKDLDLNKVDTVVAVGRQLNELIKTKLSILDLAHKTGCYEYDVEEETTE